jgi:hypothetical protein
MMLSVLGLWWLMNVEQLIKWELAEETEVLGEDLNSSCFVHHRSHITDLGSNTDYHIGKLAMAGL